MNSLILINHISSLPAAIFVPVAIGVLLLFVFLVTLVVCILCKRFKKKKKKTETMTVDENPVYQQYELVGPNYERQYSTNEVCDSNTYYVS